MSDEIRKIAEGMWASCRSEAMGVRRLNSGDCITWLTAKITALIDERVADAQARIPGMAALRGAVERLQTALEILREEQKMERIELKRYRERDSYRLRKRFSDGE